MNDRLSDSRRRIIRGIAAGALALPARRLLAMDVVLTPRQTEGPFYPDRFPLDTDNDLLIVGDRVQTRLGDVTHLSGRILDRRGRPLPNVLVEIWQVDANGVYLHSADQHAKRDAGFQGYGRYVTGSSGEYFFRTLKPVPYPGRTPHIHFKVTPKGQPAFTTQCYVQGEPLNARDAVLNGVSDLNARESLIVPFAPIPGSTTRDLSARFNIVLA
jgi:protocatechuate 3,4-dioxygenase beta subunit